MHYLGFLSNSRRSSNLIASAALDIFISLLVPTLNISWKISVYIGKRVMWTQGIATDAARFTSSTAGN